MAGLGSTKHLTASLNTDVLEISFDFIALAVMKLIFECELSFFNGMLQLATHAGIDREH